MEMSASSDLSYVDTAREQVTAEIAVNGSAGGNQLETVNNIEPFQDEGGLDRNEVAEIHAMKMTAMVSFERNGQTGGENTLPQDVSGITWFGANLDLNEQPRPTTQGPDVGAVADSNRGQPNSATALFSSTEEGLFNHIRYFGGRNYLDTSAATDTSGPYAAGSTVQVVGGERLCFPVDLGIRGPVIDENDDLSFLSRMVIENKNNFDGNSGFEVVVTADLLYRIHEIENIRNDFSLPE